MIKPPEFFPAAVKSLYDQAALDYQGFWEEAALAARKDIHWFQKWDETLVWEYPTFRWYVGGATNICYNCLDFKVSKGLGEKTAYIAERGETGEVRTVTYDELLNLVKQCAASLRALGVEKGDRVAIYMPMSIEAAVAMLACARIGAVHMVIFAGFSAGAIADRLELSGARYIITQSADTRRGKVIPLKQTVDQAVKRLADSKQVKTVVVVREGSSAADIEIVAGRDIAWYEFMKKGVGFDSGCVAMEANEPLFVLPTSGTTAKPKVVVHCHGGYQIHIYSMGKWVHGLNVNDIWFCTSDIGWIVGHSYNIYAPLLFGCTSILYQGTPDYPRPDMWWDFIERHKVTGIFTSPTGVRALIELGIEQPRQHDISSVRRIVCAGETLNPAAWEWLQQQVFQDKVPVIDHMWQTETGGPIIGSPHGIAACPIKPGSSGLPAPGIDADVVDEKDGHSLGPGEKGVVIIRRPFPGLTPTLWGDVTRYRRDYWEAKPGTQGAYLAGDASYKDEDGYFYFTGRADEVIKIAAHRIGTIEVENTLVSHPAVVEAAVCGVPDELRGEIASACIVLAKNYQPGGELKQELIQHIKREMGAIIVMKDIVFVNTLPKTRSGKIMRRVIKAVLTDADVGDISTIEEEVSVEEVKKALEMMVRT